MLLIKINISPKIKIMKKNLNEEIKNGLSNY